MEQLANKILSENGLMALLFLLTLYWLYKLAKWFLTNYLTLIETKDKAFIEKVGEIVLEVKSGWITSKYEHEKTRDLIKEKHNNVIKLLNK